MAREKATCTKCNNTYSKYMMIKVDKNNRGGRASYICNSCRFEMHSYSTKNNKHRGTAGHGFTFGMENETTYSNEKARSELYEYEMLPTADCTVDVEYKSAIEHNLKSFSHLFKVMDKLIANGDMEIGSRAGSHFHVGHEEMLTPVTMGYIRRFYQSLFVPLSDAMKANPEATKELFGREIDHRNVVGQCWARSITMDSDEMEHTNFINVQHSYTLEFRLAKFINSKQYMKMAKFANEVTKIVLVNFVAHFNDEIKDTNRYPTKKAYRKHKADMTAQKIVKAYYKAINN